MDDDSRLGTLAVILEQGFDKVHTIVGYSTVMCTVVCEVEGRPWLCYLLRTRLPLLCPGGLPMVQRQPRAPVPCLPCINWCASGAPLSHRPACGPRPTLPSSAVPPGAQVPKCPSPTEGCFHR
jgi:hypothetical protein